MILQKVITGRILPFVLESEEEPSLLEGIFEYIKDKYFTVDLFKHSYEHIDVSSGGMFNVQMIVIALFIGLVIALVLAIYHKRTLGAMILALKNADCVSPEKAETLTELGLARHYAVRQDLRSGTSLRSVVRCVGEEEFRAKQQAMQQESEQSSQDDTETQPKKKNIKQVRYVYRFDVDRFYIPEDKMFAAEIKFNRKGTNPLVLVLALVACVILLSVTCNLIPEMLKLMDNAVGLFVE